MELITLRRGARVAEWIYYLPYMHIAGSNPGGDNFPTLIALNYSLTIAKPNYANRPFVVDKLAPAEAEGQSPFVYTFGASPIVSTLGYNFKTVIHIDEVKFWYHFLALFSLEETCPLCVQDFSVCWHTHIANNLPFSACNRITPLERMAAHQSSGIVICTLGLCSF